MVLSKSSVSGKAKNTEIPEKMKPWRYLPPELPKFELLLCALFWIGHCLFAFYRAQKSTFEKRYLVEYMLETRESALIPGLNKDSTELEWEMWLGSSVRLISAMIGSSVALLLTDWLNLNCRQTCNWLTLYSLLAHLCLCGPEALAVIIAISFITIVITWKTGSILPAWILSLTSLVLVMQFPFYEDEYVFYVQSLFYTYKMIQLINFCSGLTQNYERLNEQPLLEIFPKYLLYGFYLPYSCLLIVLYDDFDRQFNERRTKPREMIFSLLFRAFRLAFWACALELFLHYFYVNAFMINSEAIKRLDMVSITCVAYIAGVLFHLKYVVIFGVPSLFASLDRMTPPGAPVCISRVSLYARVWRQFDRGLYQFLKRQVYIPLISSTGFYNPLRKITALSLCYGFVLAWHGTESRYFHWVWLNGIEVVLEMVAFSIYCQPQIRKFIDANISPRNFRRILANLQTVNVSLGLFGIFHFLGDENVGVVIAERTWWQHGVKGHYELWHLLMLGYCFNQCNMELDRWTLLRDLSSEEQDQKRK